MLFEAVRSALKAPVSVGWDLMSLREPVTASTVSRINASSGLVIGGGGLFLVDNASSAISGWQWPISRELLNDIDVPIVLWAVGYNRFRGQEEFPSVFVENLTTLLEKSAFVGIRNSGSIRALRNYLPAWLAEKLVYQPCTTTVMDYLPLAAGEAVRQPNSRPVLVVNAAFDRFGLRIRGREEETLGGVARMARRAQDNGWRVICVGHNFDDEALVPYLQRAGVKAEVKHFTGATTEEVISFYRGVDLVVGMRGHAQMIPFGLGKPIISLVSHDKMQWFLDDIGHPEWGVDFKSEEFDVHLLKAFDDASGNLDARAAQVVEARARLWNITQNNIAAARKALGF